MTWFTTGAAPVARELVDALWKRLKIPVKQGYGMTELTVLTFLQVGYQPLTSESLI
jgi:long-subunit acyl-CoA synthetase (AMP-forming)